MKSGRQYEGQWVHNRQCGQGIFSFNAKDNGLEYTGTFADDLESGEGRCTYKDGSSYTGDTHSPSLQFACFFFLHLLFLLFCPFSSYYLQLPNTQAIGAKE